MTEFCLPCLLERSQMLVVTIAPSLINTGPVWVAGASMLDCACSLSRSTADQSPGATGGVCSNHTLSWQAVRSCSTGCWLSQMRIHLLTPNLQTARIKASTCSGVQKLQQHMELESTSWARQAVTQRKQPRACIFRARHAQFVPAQTPAPHLELWGSLCARHGMERQAEPDLYNRKLITCLLALLVIDCSC